MGNIRPRIGQDHHQCRRCRHSRRDTEPGYFSSVLFSHILLLPVLRYSLFPVCHPHLLLFCQRPVDPGFQFRPHLLRHRNLLIIFPSSRKPFLHVPVFLHSDIPPFFPSLRYPAIPLKLIHFRFFRRPVPNSSSGISFRRIYHIPLSPASLRLTQILITPPAAFPASCKACSLSCLDSPPESPQSPRAAYPQNTAE